MIPGRKGLHVTDPWRHTAACEKNRGEAEAKAKMILAPQVQTARQSIMTSILNLLGKLISFETGQAFEVR